MLSRLFGTPAQAEAAPLPYDASSAEALCARWVRWIAGFGPIRNPVDDDTGEVAGDAQPADVRFLAGSFGGSVTRTCVVPAGVPLFFPVINQWEYPPSGFMPVLERATAQAALDGAPVAITEIATPQPFEVVGARGNPVTGRRKPVPVVVWGLWGRVPGLPDGRHELRFSGGDGDRFTLDVRYLLTVG